VKAKFGYITPVTRSVWGYIKFVGK